MRYIVFVLMFLSFTFGKILSVDEAFEHKISAQNGGFVINFAIDSSAYLYADMLKISVNNNQINDFLNKIPSVVKEDREVYTENFEIFIPSRLVSNFAKIDNLKLNLTYQGCSNSGFCYQILNFDYEISQQNGKFSINLIKNEQPQTNMSQQDKILSNLANSTFLFALITFFGYGLLLSLTPCVFPMIPILSSILVSKGGRNGFFLSFIYVLFSSFAYALAGILASYFGANFASFLQIPSVIIVFSIFFVIFALAMFGVFEFQMPQFIQNFADSKSKNKSGVFGVAVMGFASAMIMGPCVAAPLSGAILYIAKSGDVLLGGSALFVMGFGMGVPLLLIGLGFGKFLPKPGFWMDKIKAIFGFLMLAMAIWLLSRILSNDYSMVLYGILGVGFYVYFANEDGKKGRVLKFFSLIMLIISSFLIGNFTLNQLGYGYNAKVEQKSSAKFTYVSNLAELNDFVSKSKKPVLVDFWASWCVNCKELEEKTFKDGFVANRLNDFELVKIDVTQNTNNNIELMKNFEVFGPPVLVFFKDGVELKHKKLVGYIGVEEFLEHIKDI